jgi:hypothetical protein
MASYEVSTLLSLRDLATAPLKRYIAMLKDAQVQMDRMTAAMKLMQDAQAPGAAMLAAQRESLGIAADTTKQYEAQVASQRESLNLARQQLAVQRSIGAAGGGRFVSSVNKAGSKLMWGGVGIVGGLAYSTQKAIDFNQTTLQTDMALGGFRRSAAQRTQDMAALQKAAFTGSSATGFFTAQAIMEGLQKAASSGMRPLVDKMGMGVFTQIVPTLATYMDVLGRLKGESADTAALEAMQLVHMFGAYKPAAINKTLSGVAMLSLLMPDTMGKAISALSYVAPTGIQLAGMNVSDIAAFVATADQSGLGRGRSGARLKDYIESIAVVQSKAREAAKTTLGIRGAIGKDGALDLAKSFDILIGDKARMSPQAFRDAVRTAFGAQGDVVAAMFGDKSKTGMFQANRAAIQGSMDRGDLGTVQNILKGGAAGKEAAAWATLQNDIVQFGQYGIPIAIKFFDTINPRLKEFSNWMSAHPKDADKLFNDLLKAGEGMIAIGLLFKSTGGIMSTINTIKGIASGIGAVSKAGKTLIPALGEGSGLAGRFGLLFDAASKVGGPLAVVVGAIDTLWGIIKDANSFGRNPSASQFAWDAFKRVSPFGFLLPKTMPSWPHSGGSGHAVHVQTLNVNLPRDSDAGHARRIVNTLRNLTDVVPGAWNSVPSH